MLNPPVIELVRNRTSGIVNATTTLDLLPGGNFFGGLENYDSLAFLINVTNPGGATGTVNIYIQDSWNFGQTWDDLVSSLALTLGTTQGAQRFAVEALLEAGIITTATFTALTQGSAPTQESLAAGSVRRGPFGDRIRIREKVSSVSGTPSGCIYSVTMIPCRSSLR